MKVAAYCRLDSGRSTLFQLHERLCELKVKVNPAWELTGFYVDYDDNCSAYERMISETEKTSLVVVLGRSRHSTTPDRVKEVNYG